ncbi:MAG: aspartate/glutamate racemase family protein [Aigarchaeota archaeon]|nr:aspartate/glutamate racemase family protein [Aigarchaeota archaeon]MCX8193062.1 aspartate/glutamate racemase family protein [Nitrososphaeria archaeon]MDW7986911.1 aspartate/glutamate racemase family protein [Nitrososphaerota archaeon]
MVRIFVLNPVSTDLWNKITEESLKKIACINTELHVENLEEGPRYIESELDVVSAAPHVVKKVVEAEEKGFDAVVINCFDDPGLDAAREKVSILTLGIGETSIITALQLGYKFAIISTGEKSKASYDLKAHKLGVKSRLAYASGINMRVLELRRDDEQTKKMLLHEAMIAVEKFNAEVIVLGCGGMIGFGEWLSERLMVPVIDPTITTFKIAEALSSINLKHSKRYLYRLD